jgi:hypothetical protein
MSCVDPCHHCGRSVYRAGRGTSGERAHAAPSGIGSAQDTVNELENNGFKVVLSKMGAGPLDHRTVDSVRPGETVIRPFQNGRDPVNQIVYQTVYLTAKC